MARSRRPKFRTRTRTVTRTVRKGLFNRWVGGFAYGLIRNPVKQGVNNIVRGVPGLNALAGVSDELLLLGAATVVNNFAGRGELGKIARTAQTIEMANLGESINLGGIGSVFSGQGSTSSPAQTTTPQGGQANF